MHLIEITPLGGDVSLVPVSSLGMIERHKGDYRWYIDCNNETKRIVCGEEPLRIETFPAEPGVFMLEAYQSEDGTCWEWTSSRVIAWRCGIGVFSGLTTTVTPVVDVQQGSLKNQVLIDTSGKRARLVDDEYWSENLLEVLARSVGATQLELLPTETDLWEAAEKNSIRARRGII